MTNFAKFLAGAALAASTSFAQAGESPAYMVIQHDVADYESWRAVFDDVIDLRRGAGETSALVLQDAADPNKLTLVFGWTSLEDAAAYAANPKLAAAMKRAGVVSKPVITYLSDAD